MDTIELWEKEIESCLFENMDTSLDFFFESLNESGSEFIKEKFLKVIEMIKTFFQELKKRISQLINRCKEKIRNIKKQKPKEKLSDEQIKEKVVKLVDEKSPIYDCAPTTVGVLISIIKDEAAKIALEIEKDGSSTIINNTYDNIDSRFKSDNNLGLYYLSSATIDDTLKKSYNDTTIMRMYYSDATRTLELITKIIDSCDKILDNLERKISSTSSKDSESLDDNQDKYYKALKIIKVFKSVLSKTIITTGKTISVLDSIINISGYGYILKR